jgi:hypothetical protein
MRFMENQEDERCCGTGTCIINAQGLCWCGQQWDGEKMCRPALASGPHSALQETTATAPQDNGTETP